MAQTFSDDQSQIIACVVPVAGHHDMPGRVRDMCGMEEVV